MVLTITYNMHKSDSIPPVAGGVDISRSVVSSGCTLSSAEEETTEGYIFIGDSRFVGMNKCCSVDDLENTFVVAKVSEGYDWFITEALPKVYDIINTNDNINNWTLVLGLGINDLHNIDKYLSAYQDLGSEFNLVLVSVNPIEGCSSISNEDIRSFNNQLKSLGYDFIDTNSYITSRGYSTTDGIHYTSSTYKDIFTCICKSLGY